MDSSTFDIPDPSDWLNTPLSAFSSLENALHCDICKEFYDTPMITSCSHTFCSKCIRTCLSANGKCPSCQAPDQAGKLRNNWVLQTVVEQFLEARPKALEVARREREEAANAKKSGKRKRNVHDTDDVAQASQDGRTTRSKSRRIATSSQTSQPEAIEIEDTDGDDAEYAPETEPDDGLVECLFGCGKRIKPEEMDTHLDKCEQEKQEAQRAKSRRPTQNFGLRSTTSQQAKIPERISELNHSLLNDVRLRQKLRSAGVPNWGPRQLLIKRHTEWVNLWNANCDSGGRKSQWELLRDLDAWERAQGGTAPHANGLSSTIMRKDFDGEGWASNNKDNFSRLIADARRKKNSTTNEAGKEATTEAGKEATKKPELADGGYARDVDLLDDHHTTAQPKPESSLSPPELNIGPEQTIHPSDRPSESQPVVQEEFEAANDSSIDIRRASSAIDPSKMLEGIHFGSQDEHAVENNTTPGLSCDLSVHLQSSPVRKVPMFMIPQQPVSDVDAGGEGR